MAMALSFLPLATFHHDAKAEPISQSPWEHSFWQKSSPAMRAYACRYAWRAPQWCESIAADRRLYAVEEAEMFGPQITADDVRWLRLLESGDPQSLDDEDVAFIHNRAEANADPQAMEILGYLYSQGLGVKQDYGEAYIWYGRAYLSGESHVQENMDIVWSLLNQTDQVRAREIAQQYNLPEVK
ncbi:MAG: SEL1-like repeat protein [Pseudomonadota bacterium]